MISSSSERGDTPRGTHLGAAGVTDWAAALDAVAAAVGALGAEAWIVGGTPRDVLLGRGVGDVDLAVTCAPRALAAALRGAQGLTVAHLKRDSVRLGVQAGAGAPPLQLDASPLHGPGIAADLTRRDFTCNALALPFAARAELLAAMTPVGDPSARRAAMPSLVDPLSAMRDIAHRALRVASSHALADEPGRIVRAARMIAALGFSPDARLMALARTAAPLLARLTPERVREEMNTLLALPACAEGLRFLADVTALAALVPPLADETKCRRAGAAVAATRWLQDEIPAGQDVGPFARLATLARLRQWYAAPLPEGIARIVALRWGLLLAVAGEGDAPQFSRVRLSRQVRATVDAVAEGGRWRALLADRDPSMAELRAAADRWRDRFVDLLTGAVADEPAETVATRARAILDRYFADREAFIPPPLLDGQAVLRELGVAPGPAVGRVLRAVREAQLAGEVAAREEALALAREIVRGA